MPVGDSITMGAGSIDQGGYRHPLLRSLQQRGWAVDMVGKLKTGVGKWDRDHEGRGGRTSWWWSQHIDSAVERYDPDVILLMVGTNDIVGMRRPLSIVADVLEIINRTVANSSGRFILVSSIPIALRWPERSSQYNTVLEQAVEALGNPNVVFVDTSRDLFPEDIAPSYDPKRHGLHPNRLGYSKITDGWLRAFEVLGVSRVCRFGQNQRAELPPNPSPP